MAAPGPPGWSVGPASVALLGERVVTRDNAVDVAERANAQAAAIFADAAGWTAVRMEDGGTAETKPVSGTFAATGCILARGSREVGVPADALFRFLITPKGYRVIDPAPEPEEYAKYLERFEGWRPHIKGTKLEVANAFMVFPKRKSREFIVLNSHDPATRVFTSTSMLHRSRPGGSKYQSEMEVNGPETVRVLNTFALQCHPLGAKRCRVDVLNWVDMSTGNAERENKGAVKFFAALFGRMAKVTLEDTQGSAKL